MYRRQALQIAGLSALPAASGCVRQANESGVDTSETTDETSTEFEIEDTELITDYSWTRRTRRDGDIDIVGIYKVYCETVGCSDAYVTTTLDLTGHEGGLLISIDYGTGLPDNPPVRPVLEITYEDEYGRREYTAYDDPEHRIGYQPGDSVSTEYVNALYVSNTTVDVDVGLKRDNCGATSNITTDDSEARFDMYVIRFYTCTLA